jgi:hypothetical protein
MKEISIMLCIFFIVFMGFWIAVKIEHAKGKRINTITGFATIRKFRIVQITKE